MYSADWNRRKLLPAPSSCDDITLPCPTRNKRYAALYPWSTAVLNISWDTPVSKDKVARDFFYF